MTEQSRIALAEAIGTMILVVGGPGTAILATGGFLATSSVGELGVAIAFGLSLLCAAYAIGSISGCHINPAVTIGAWLSGRIPMADALGYWAAQFIGGILGALLLWGTFSCSPLYSRSKTGLGADGWGAASHIHINAGGAFLTEVMLTALFVFAVLGATSKTANAATAGIVIGFSLTVVHLIGIPITGTSVNPARSLGPALIVGGTALNQVWLFIVAPLIGGAVAAGLHRVLYPEPPIEALASGEVPSDLGR
jgi:aquaporin Z